MLNTKTILKYYPSLRIWSDDLVGEAYKGVLSEQLITEYSFTVYPEKTIQTLKQKYSNIVDINFFKRGENIIKINLTFKDKLIQNLQEINNFMDSFGWYPAFINYKNGGKYSDVVSKLFDFKNVIISYEAKYNKSIDISNQQFLYHITPDLKWKKIKSYGLTAKTLNKLSDHPGRIYLLKNIDNLEDFGGDIIDLSFELLKYYPYKDRVKEMYLLKIDTTKLLPNTIFFDDPNFYMGEAVWTYNNIPPTSITIEKQIDITH